MKIIEANDGRTNVFKCLYEIFSPQFAVLCSWAGEMEKIQLRNSQLMALIYGKYAKF